MIIILIIRIESFDLEILSNFYHLCIFEKYRVKGVPEISLQLRCNVKKSTFFLAIYLYRQKM